MIYKVILLPKADIHYAAHIKAGNAILVNRIDRLLNELKQHPYIGTGKPHRLKYYENENVWSRRIDERHRMLYTVEEGKVTVFVMSLWGHYGDK